MTTVFDADASGLPRRKFLAGLTKHGFSASDLMAIDRGNALRLFPNLKA